MGASWENIGIMMICINIFIYIGASYTGLTLVSGDMLSTYFKSDYGKNDLLKDSSASNFTVNSDVIEQPAQITAMKGIFDNVLQLLDPLEIAFNFVKTVFNILFAPLLLTKIQGIPYIITYIVSAPLLLAYWFSIFRFVRGA